MRDTDLFQLALGLVPPWMVAGTAFDAEAKRLDIHIDFPRGSKFACPACGAADCPAHDTEEMSWRHLNFFQHEAFLHARVPRVRCAKCGVKRVSVPWARPGSGFTLLFEAMTMVLVRAMPVNAVARHVSEHDTRLWRIIHHYVGKARRDVDYSDVTRVAFDETASRRGHNYVTLFVDLDRARVLFATEGKDAATVKAFADDLVQHGGDPEAVTEVCIDMSQAFIKGAAAHLPKADITFDKFHAVQIVNEAVDQVRRTEQKDRKDLLAKTRYIWLKNPENLSDKSMPARQVSTQALPTATKDRLIVSRPDAKTRHIIYGGTVGGRAALLVSDFQEILPSGPTEIAPPRTVLRRTISDVFRTAFRWPRATMRPAGDVLASDPDGFTIPVQGTVTGQYGECMLLLYVRWGCWGVQRTQYMRSTTFDDNFDRVHHLSHPFYPCTNIYMFCGDAMERSKAGKWRLFIFAS